MESNIVHEVILYGRKGSCEALTQHELFHLPTLLDAISAVPLDLAFLPGSEYPPKLFPRFLKVITATTMAMTKPVSINSTTTIMIPMMIPDPLFWALICVATVVTASSLTVVVIVSVEVDTPDERVGKACVMLDVSPLSVC